VYLCIKQDVFEQYLDHCEKSERAKMNAGHSVSQI
jgi:hypothetical protein